MLVKSLAHLIAYVDWMRVRLLQSTSTATSHSTIQFAMATPPSANEGELAISLASIRAAAARIEGVAHRTPVLTSRLLDAVAAETQHEPELRLFFKVWLTIIIFLSLACDPSVPLA